MRDPERIMRMLEKLEILWTENPDWRLGQLVFNAAYAGEPVSRDVDVWNVEDDVVEVGLDKFL